MGDWRGKEYSLPLDYYFIFDIGFGIYAFYATLIAFYYNAYSFIPITLLVSVSLLYMGILTVYHSVSRVNLSFGRLSFIRILAIISLVVAVLFTLSYAFNVYNIARAGAEIERVMVSVYPEEVITGIDNAMQLLPDSGNPVWLFPTPMSDLELIKRDLLSLRSRLTYLIAMENSLDYFTAHSILEDTREALGVILGQLRNIQPFALLTLAGLVSGVVVISTALATVVMRRRG